MASAPSLVRRAAVRARARSSPRRVLGSGSVISSMNAPRRYRRNADHAQAPYNGDEVATPRPALRDGVSQSYARGSHGLRLTTRPGREGPGQSRPATRVCAAASAPTPNRATARVTGARTARRATRARSSGTGPESASSLPWVSGVPATGGCPRPMTGHARTHAGVGEMGSSDPAEESGHQRAWLRRCSELGPPPAHLRCVERQRPQRDRPDAIPVVCRFASRLRVSRPSGLGFGEMRVAAPFGLGSCFDVGAVPRRAPTTRLSSFQRRCVARLREARRQTRCPPRPEV
jgi:hypothetical protein